MAIIIPSKYIYRKENPKVRDNVIDRIEVECNLVHSADEYSTPVYSAEYDSVPIKEIDQNTKIKDFTGDDKGHLSLVYFLNSVGYYVGTIKIPRNQKNEYITKLYKGEKKENGETVQEDVLYYTLYGNKTTQPMSTVVYQKPNVSIPNSEIGTFTYGKEVLEEDVLIEIPKLPIVISKKNTVTMPAIEATVVGVSNQSTYTVVESDEYFTINLKLLTIFTTEEMTGVYNMASLVVPHDIPISGTRTEYVAKRMSITVYGNTIGIDLANQTVIVGNTEGNKPFSVDGNELMQTSNYYENQNCLAIENSFSKTLQHYSNGKETAILLCSISDYYTDGGELKISANGKVGETPDSMVFQVGDEVIPMVMGTDGKDRPLSKKNDSAKVFRVIGVKPYYDGAVWQEISLQEV